MKEKTYTHKELANLLDVSETTIKSYRKKFPNCLPIINTGKPIRFSHEALKVCERIRDLFQEGMAIIEVHSRLAEEFPWIDPPSKKNISQTSQTTDISIPINAIAQGVMTLLQQQKEILRKLDTTPRSHTSSPKEELSPTIPQVFLSYPIMIQKADSSYHSIAEGLLPRFTLMDVMAMLNYNFQHPDHYIVHAEFTGRTLRMCFEQPLAAQSHSFTLELLPTIYNNETILLLTTFLLNGQVTPIDTLISFLRS